MPRRRLLFVLFDDDPCKLNHALMYALDLTGHGHQVVVILEGEVTAAALRLDDGESKFSGLFRKALEQRLIRGACRRASGGCATGDPERNVAAALEARGIQLLDGMEGHAGIASYLEQGYELVAF